jgi:hypothetical protein
MKKLILALLAAGTITAANAQEPHSILLYGDASFSTTRDAMLGKQTDWHATPGVGYQFNHNWTVGLNIMWGQHANKTANGVKTTDNLYAVGPFARYSRYIGKSETFFWFAQGNFDYAGGYTTSGGAETINKHNGVALEVYPALGINVGRGVCLNFSVGGVGYSTDKYSNNSNPSLNTNASNTFDLSFGHQTNIGISKNFNCGHKMHSHHEPGDEVHRRKADKMEDEDDAAPKPKKKERNRDDDE